MQSYAHPYHFERLFAVLLCVMFSQASFAIETTSSAKVEKLKKRAEAGDAAAQCDLGQLFEHGDGVPMDLSTARYWYRYAALKGDAIGQCNYGTMLIYGLGGNQDRAMAKDLFEKAAAQKSKYGFYELGVVYEQGLGVKPDYDKAFEYYKKAALGGVTQAMNNLASMKAHGLLKGDWTPLQLYKQAAEHGDSTAEFNIGMLYLDGDSVPKNERLAVEWLTKAARHGDVEAQCNLGVILANGGEGVPVQTQDAIKWLTRAATAGDGMAKQALARIYRDGNGVPKNPADADRWWPHPLP
ncbi:MAG TPA: tetratricopeptide repeat protein [Planktothrix sp.]|jgi:hypothetical protein